VAGVFVPSVTTNVVRTLPPRFFALLYGSVPQCSYFALARRTENSFSHDPPQFYGLLFTKYEAASSTAKPPKDPRTTCVWACIRNCRAWQIPCLSSPTEIGFVGETWVPPFVCSADVSRDPLGPQVCWSRGRVGRGCRTANAAVQQCVPKGATAEALECHLKGHLLCRNLRWSGSGDAVARGSWEYQTLGAYRVQVEPRGCGWDWRAKLQDVRGDNG